MTPGPGEFIRLRRLHFLLPRFVTIRHHGKKGIFPNPPVSLITGSIMSGSALRGRQACQVLSSQISQIGSLVMGQ